MRPGPCFALACALTWVALAPPPARGEEPTPVFGARAEVQAPQAPRQEVAGQREVIHLRRSHGDSFSVVESMPSALPVFSGVPYLLIRGAPPSGTATIYDGAPIPAFHHLALGPAIAHLSLVSSVRFHAGVAPARYGRHIGGVQELSAPDISPPRTNAELELNAIDSQALVSTEGRRWIAAHARYGYPSIWLDAIDAGVKLGYGDYQLRAVTPLGTQALATVHVYGAFDSLGETGQPQDDIVLSFHRVVGRYVRQARGWEISAALYAGYDTGELGQELSGSTLRIGPSMYAEHTFDADTRLRLGADLEGKLADIDQHTPIPASNPDGPRRPEDYLPPSARADTVPGPEDFIDQSPLRDTLARSAAGVYAELDLFRTRLVRVETGVRTDLWMLGGYHTQSVDPRAVLRLVPSDRIELHAAAGAAHQSVASPLPVPGLAGVELDTGLHRAVHTELGVRFPKLLGVELAVTGYYHRLYDVAYLELILDCEGNSDWRVFDPRLPDFESICRASGLPRADGSSYGVELLARPRWSKRLTGFVTYTLGGASAENADGTRFTPQSDVRHLGNLVLGYDFGGGFRSGVRAHYRSGKSAVNTFYDQPQSRYERRETRLPPFFRADVYVSYSFETFAPTTITAGVQNVTFSREATKRDCLFDRTLTIQCAVDYQPAIVLPNVGLRVEL